jgi:hypothetical protein
MSFLKQINGVNSIFFKKEGSILHPAWRFLKIRQSLQGSKISFSEFSLKTFDNSYRERYVYFECGFQNVVGTTTRTVVDCACLPQAGN